MINQRKAILPIILLFLFVNSFLLLAKNLLTKYGLDIHADSFMHDPASLRKLKQIIETDYPLLKTSNVKAI